MSSTAITRGGLRCSHCGRELAETMHTRASYRVDYYALHTGDVEPMTMAPTDESAPLVTFFKLLRPSDVLTCVDCYQQPQVRRERELLFRPELAMPQEAVS